MKWKHVAIPTSLCMAAVLSLGLPAQVLAGSPEFARTAEEWAKLRDDILEYGEIEDLVHEYNVTVLNNQRQYELERYDLDIADDLVSSYLGQASQNWEAAGQATNDAERAQYQAAARSAEQSALANVKDRKTSEIEKNLAEKRIVKQAQSSMNTYYQLQSQLTSLKKNRELLAALVGSTQGRQSQGMATAADVLDAQQKVQNADSQIIALESQIESTRQNLIVMLGWQQGAVPQICPMPEVDMNRIAAMNIETDTQKALEADYTLDLDVRKERNANNQTNRDIYRQKVDDDRQQIAVAVSDGYQKVMQAKSSYDEAVLNLDVASKNWNTANTKYQLGTISRIENLQAEVALVAAQSEHEQKKLELFQALENYDWIIKGVRS